MTEEGLYKGTLTFWHWQPPLEQHCASPLNLTTVLYKLCSNIFFHLLCTPGNSYAGSTFCVQEKNILEENKKKKDKRTEIDFQGTKQG